MSGVHIRSQYAQLHSTPTLVNLWSKRLHPLISRFYTLCLCDFLRGQSTTEILELMIMLLVRGG